MIRSWSHRRRRSAGVCVYDEFYNSPNYYANVHIKTCLQGVPAITVPQVSLSICQ